MSDRRKLIVVSNRGPLFFDRDANGERIVRRGGGGLVTALRGLIADHDVTWIASAMSDEDRVVAREHGDEPIEESRNDVTYWVRLRRARPARLRPLLQRRRKRHVLVHPALPLGPRVDARHRAVVPHRLARRLPAREPRVRGRGARRSSTAIPTPRSSSRTTTSTSRRGYVREARPDARLLQFIHIPWAQTDYWHVLPEDVRRAVHEGLLANDVVGFHTHRWRRNFIESCMAITGAEWDSERECLVHDGRRTHVVMRPIGIDPDEFDALKEHPAVLAEERRIVETRPEVLIVRVDRTDPVEERRARLPRVRAAVPAISRSSRAGSGCSR